MFLRRAELEVVTVGIGDKLIRGAHGILVGTDTDDSPYPDKGSAGRCASGRHAGHAASGKGGRGSANDRVRARQRCADRRDLRRPFDPGTQRPAGKNRRAVCFPGFEEELCGAVYCDQPVVVDLPFVTAKGAGAAMDFALELVSRLASGEMAAKLRASSQCR